MSESTPESLTHDPSSPAVPEAGRLQIAKWLLLRVAAPLAITVIVIKAMQGDRYFDIYLPLAWFLFLLHMFSTSAFGRTHVLDTGSFVFLMISSARAADIGETRQLSDPAAWLGFALWFAAYLVFSFIGRSRADRSGQVARSVSPPQVAAAVVLLIVGVIVCSTSKTAVGFLLVPALILVPFVLLWSLATGRPKT